MDVIIKKTETVHTFADVPDGHLFVSANQLYRKLYNVMDGIFFGVKVPDVGNGMEKFYPTCPVHLVKSITVEI